MHTTHHWLITAWWSSCSHTAVEGIISANSDMISLPFNVLLYRKYSAGNSFKNNLGKQQSILHLHTHTHTSTSFSSAWSFPLYVKYEIALVTSNTHNNLVQSSSLWLTLVHPRWLSFSLIHSNSPWYNPWFTYLEGFSWLQPWFPQLGVNYQSISPLIRVLMILPALFLFDYSSVQHTHTQKHTHACTHTLPLAQHRHDDYPPHIQVL